MGSRKLYKIEEGKKLAGVCGGLADAFNIDPTLVRLLWTVFALCWGSGLILYIVCAFIFPKKSEIQ